MALADLGRAVGLGRERAGRQHARERAEAHGGALVAFVALLGHEVDDGGAALVELARARASARPATLRANSIGRELHAEADAEERDFALARVADRLDFALDAAIPEAAGDEDRVEVVERGRWCRRAPVLRVDVDEATLAVVLQAAVDERLVERLVGVAEVHVLADDGDAHLPAGRTWMNRSTMRSHASESGWRVQMLSRSTTSSSRPSACRRWGTRRCKIHRRPEMTAATGDVGEEAIFSFVPSGSARRCGR
jgi:hypothetical protein